MKVEARGTALIRSPALNKGTGFPIAERQAFSRLTYLLRVHGAKDSRLPAIDKAFATWRALAETIETASHDAPHE